MIPHLQFKSFDDLGAKSDLPKEIKDFKYKEDELEMMRDMMKNE